MKPGDDFYRHAGGTWIQNNPIPPDRTVWDTSRILGAKAEVAVRDLIEGLAKQPDTGSVDRKIADYYRAFMDVAAIEAAGLEPIARDLQRMTKAQTKAELMSVAADPTVRARLPINAYVGLDEKNPDRYIVTVLHAGLGLPDREYYLSDKFAEIRAKYQAHIAQMLTLAGQVDGAAKAQRILALETSIAKLHWTSAERRDRDRRYNRKTRVEMLALLDGYPMQAELQALGWDQQAEFIVRELDALPKLAALFRSWRDYSALEVRPDDPVGNLKRFIRFEFNRRLARINQPTDRDEWAMTPQTVDAYYNPTFNEMVFPAAVLQPPYFDPYADAAVNYGGIGGVIGHEMSHGFDDQGAKLDARGVLREWWQSQDVAAFKALTGRLVDQYAQFEALPGVYVNGQLTLGENIGDNGGLSVALAAYRLSLQGKQAPVLANLTGEQRFFLSWAQIWRTQIREQRLRNHVMSDPHSPAEFRVNGTVRNMPEWYEAFNVQPDQKLFLPPEQRVAIW